MGRAGDVIQEVCPFDDKDPGQQWIPAPANFLVVSFFSSLQSTEEAEYVPTAADAGVKTLISENTRDSDADASVVSGRRRGWIFPVSSNVRAVKAARGTSAATISNLTMETINVTKV